MIRGNSEQYLVDYEAGRFPALAATSQQWAPLRWTRRQLDAEAFSFLEGLPQQAVFTADGAWPARVVHGSPRKLTEGLSPDALPEVVGLFETANLSTRFQAANVNLSVVWPEVTEALFICGHTHIGWAQHKDGRLALNPGSLGAPINGDRRGQYALLNWNGQCWQVELRAFEYDLGLVRRAYQRTGFLEVGGAFSRACLLNTETGLNVAWFFVCHVLDTMRQMGLGDGEGFPDEAWFEAERTFDWNHYESQR
jgi:hypothetical protein